MATENSFEAPVPMRAPDPRPAAESDRPRILILSMRNLTTHASRCATYEFEDTISACDAVDVVAPVRTPSPGRISRRLQRSVGRPDWTVTASVPLEPEYDLLLATFQEPSDLEYFARLRGIRERCRRTACMLQEVWASQMDQWRPHLRALSEFDVLFTPLASSTSTLSELSGRPCHFVIGAADALRFCPYPGPPDRSIDVYSMGRRSKAVHRALLDLADAGTYFYLYDTVANFSVMNPAEHRALLRNFVKRTRYFLAYPAKFDSPEETHGQQEVGLRHFEGAAGGAVMLGSPPRCQAYEDHFDWPDAVVPVSTSEPSDIREVIAELDRQPERVERIRRNNIVNALLRHDWVYRWRQMLDVIGLAPSEGMSVREAQLKRLAAMVLASLGSL